MYFVQLRLSHWLNRNYFFLAECHYVNNFVMSTIGYNLIINNKNKPK